MLYQSAQALDPIAIVAIQHAINFPHFGTVNMAANHTVVTAVAGLMGQRHFEIRDEVDRHLDLVLEVGRQGPVGKAQAFADQVEIVVHAQSQLVGVVAQISQPFGKTDDAVEIVAMGNPHAASVDGGVDRVVHDFDAAEMVVAEFAGKLVVVTGYKNHFAALAGPAQQLLHHIVMRLRPVPALAQLPAIHNVAHQVQVFAGVVFQKVQQRVGLAAYGSQMQIGDKNRAKAWGVFIIGHRRHGHSGFDKAFYAGIHRYLMVRCSSFVWPRAKGAGRIC